VLCRFFPPSWRDVQAMDDAMAQGVIERLDGNETSAGQSLAAIKALLGRR